MLYCTVHARVYCPSLSRWFPTDPEYIHGLRLVMPIVDGVCDACVQEANTSLLTPYPDLHQH